MKKEIRNPKFEIRKLLIILLVLLFLIILGNNFRKSLFFRKTDRINLVVYDKYPVFYSLGMKDKTNYKIIFYPDLKVTVPGGYNQYRVGALGKLVNLEKKPDIFKKAFSYATFSFVDYYFYPTSHEIYYGQKKDILISSSWSRILFFKSNADLFDRLFLLLNCYLKRSSDFNELELVEVTDSNKDKILVTDDTLKSLLGYFYRLPYREEKFNIQLIYSTSYSTANLVAQIIEGSGIRVVDISQKEQDVKRHCEIVTQINQSTQTIKDLKNFFHCQLIVDKTEMSDIVLKLGNLERDWEVQ